MDKVTLRKKYTALRSELSDEQVDNFSLDIANLTLKIPIWDKTNYHLFLSIVAKKEIDTEYLLQILSGKDKNIILSKSDFKTGLMESILLTDNTTLKINTYGIPEPINGFKVPEQDIEVVFIPLLAFDEKGNRIGYGKGFYDRFLEQCKPETLKIGLSFFEAEAHISDIADTDIPLDYCITPKKIYRF